MTCKNELDSQITSIQIVEATQFNELTIVISLDSQPTIKQQNDLFSINENAVVLCF